MASLKALRDRISSVKATQKITKAMQMVAATKLRRAQQAAEVARPYVERLGSALANASEAAGSAADLPPLIKGTGKDEVFLLVVCTAERGLCGSFNEQIARHARLAIRELLSQGKKVKIFTIGRKGHENLRREFPALIIEHQSLKDVKKVDFKIACTIAQHIMRLFSQGEFDVCRLFYSHFKSVIQQKPVDLQLLPYENPAQDALAEKPAQPRSLYDYEPDIVTLLEDLAEHNLQAQIFRALLENAAGEMGAKMTAMDNATRNAGDMITRLSVSFNRQRQAQITTELVEIIAGAEAL